MSMSFAPAPLAETARQIAPLFFSGDYDFSEASAGAYRQHWEERHWVRFPGLLLGPGFPLLRDEVFRLRECAFRRHFHMECMDGSPRYMNTLGGEGIQELSTLIPLLYSEPGFVDWLSSITGWKLTFLEDMDRYVINDLIEVGDTFGAHYDDYPISVVFCIEGTSADQGGVTEMVPRARSLADIHGPDVERLALPTGDVYMLKTDTTAHRVSPLLCPARRTVINLAYSYEGFVIAAPTESASLLYKPGYQKKRD